MPSSQYDTPAADGLSQAQRDCHRFVDDMNFILDAGKALGVTTNLGGDADYDDERRKWFDDVLLHVRFVYDAETLFCKLEEFIKAGRLRLLHQDNASRLTAHCRAMGGTT